MNPTDTPFRLDRSRNATVQVFEHLRELIVSLVVKPGTVPVRPVDPGPARRDRALHRARPRGRDRRPARALSRTAAAARLRASGAGRLTGADRYAAPHIPARPGFKHGSRLCIHPAHQHPLRCRYGRYRNGMPIQKWLCHQEIAVGARPASLGL